MTPEQFITPKTAEMLLAAGCPDISPDNFVTTDGIRTDYIEPPTQAQAMRWLREEMLIYIELTYIGYCKEAEDYNDWAYRLFDGDINDYLKPAATMCSTYEAAAEAGIQAACKYLIEKGGDE